jgi:hypothetical protein
MAMTCASKLIYKLHRRQTDGIPMSLLGGVDHFPFLF